MSNQIYPGDEVICIDDSTSTNTPTRLKKGEKYIVNSIHRSNCCKVVVITVGIKAVGYSQICRSCGKVAHAYEPGTELWFNIKRFAKVDNSLSETTIEQILEEPQTVLK